MTADRPDGPPRSAFPPGGGEMGARIRAHDWAETPLGPIEGWPQSLRTVVGLMLAARQPVHIAWGAALTSLFNDGYIPILGGKHPGALGKPYAELFAEIWDEYRPVAEATMAGEAQHFVDRPVALAGRPGQPASWFTFSWTPLRDEAGAVAGFFCAATETTEKVRAEAALRESGAAALRDSERRYRALFRAMDEGYLLADVLFDERGRPADIRYVEANPAATRLLGSDWTGRLLSEISPDYEPHWCEIWGRVARTGRGERLERYAAPDRAWYDFYVFKPEEGADSRRVAVIFKDVTDRKRAEEALRESGARQAFLLRLSDALRPLADPTEIQDAAARLLGEHLGVDRAGYAELECDGETMSVARDWRRPGAPSLVGRYRIDDFGDFFTRALREGGTSAIEDVANDPRVPRENYARTWGAIHTRSAVAHALVKGGRFAAAVFVHGNRPRRWSDNEIRLVAEAGERTWEAVERARAEAALRESEGRFRTLAEAIEEVFYVTDLDRNALLYLSPAYERVWGRPAAELHADLGSFTATIHPDDRARLAVCKAAQERGEPVVIEYRVLRPDGEARWVHDRSFPVGGGPGRQAAGIASDVTERKRAHDALREGDARQRALIEGLPQLVWRSAAGGDWTWAGPQWCAYTGFSVEDSLGHGWLDALHPDDRGAALEAWREAGADGPFQVDCRVRHAGSGRHAWFQMRGVPVRGGDGRVVEWIGSSTDIDDQVRAREVLARGREELEALVAARTSELMAAEETLRQSQKMEAVGQLTGGVAHDFNNMLQGVAGGLDMARRRIADGRPEEASRYLDAAGGAVDRAAGLTRRLLAFARRQRLDPKPVDADALVGGMADLVRRTVGPAAAVELALRIGAWSVLCDANELESALLNLCINARDAMPEGGRLLIGTERARLSAADAAGEEGAAPGDYVAISVSDTGTGMAPEVLERVFEPFFTTKPLGQGTGLGLSQTYGFARQSGGFVRIESAPGRGTSVRLFLPKHERAEDPAEERAPPATVPERAVAGATVLLVDDEAGVRGPAAERLRELGHQVLEAPDGPAALRLLGEGARVDLLVTDVGLPNGMNGRQVAEAVRERAPGTPVLFITGYAAGTRLPPGTEVIGKPFDLDALARRVQAALTAVRAGPSGTAAGPRSWGRPAEASSPRARAAGQSGD